MLSSETISCMWAVLNSAQRMGRELIVEAGDAEKQLFTQLLDCKVEVEQWKSQLVAIPLKVKLVVVQLLRYCQLSIASC